MKTFIFILKLIFILFILTEEINAKDTFSNNPNHGNSPTFTIKEDNIKQDSVFKGIDIQFGVKTEMPKLDLTENKGKWIEKNIYYHFNDEKGHPVNRLVDVWCGKNRLHNSYKKSEYNRNYRGKICKTVKKYIKN